jgi:hypothetical protein
MDLKTKLTYARRHGIRRRPRDTAKLAAQLAPPEERAQGAHQEVGAIVVDNNNGGISKDLIEGGKERNFLGLEPVVMIIVLAMLAWTLFIAWKITEMPNTP